MSNLGQRLLTALVLIPALSAALFLDPSPWGILLATWFASGLAMDELLRMGLPIQAGDIARGLRLMAALAGSALIGAFLYAPETTWLVLWTSALAIGTAILLRPHALPNAGRHFATVLAGLVYIPVLAATWPVLKTQVGPGWLFVTLAIAFLGDSVAYFAGRALGRHKLYPAVSPNKTVEGALGGLVGGVAATLGFGTAWLLPELPWTHAIALGLVGNAVGQIGDLVESMIKRTFGVKDSGAVLPGHGGMLDRIDALLFVGPVVLTYVALFAG